MSLKSIDPCNFQGANEKGDDEIITDIMYNIRYNRITKKNGGLTKREMMKQLLIYVQYKI